MNPTCMSKSCCPCTAAVENIQNQHRPFVLQPRHVPPPKPHVNHIGSSTYYAAQIESVPYDDDVHTPGQYDDAPTDPFYNGMKAGERSAAIALVTGDNIGRATPVCTIPFGVVTPAQTSMTIATVASPTKHDLAMPDLDSSLSYNGSPQQVLLGRGGHTCNNAGNVAATEFFCSRSPTYKKLKDKDKKPFVESARKEFIKKGYTFWVKHEGCTERATKCHVVNYVQHKLREGKITPQERKEKNAIRKEKHHQNLRETLENKGSMMN